MRFSLTTTISFISIFSACAEAKLSIKAPKLVITSGQGVVEDTINLSKKPLTTVIKQDDSLRLTFNVFDDETKANVQPHQTFLRFWDERAEEEGIIPVRVSRDGKARFNMNLRKPPSGLPPSSIHPLNVSLILGSYTYAPAHIPLFDISLPPSAPVQQHAEESFYHVQPEIFHTFRPEQKHPFKVISLVFAGATLAPWLLLLTLLSKLPISLKPDGRTLPFLTLLTAFEGLLFWYWVDLKLFQVLAYGSILGLVTAAAGKRALSVQ